MNILVLNWKDIKNPTAGGAELVTYEHAKRWIRDGGHSVTWLASSFKGAKNEEVVDGIGIRRFGNIYTIYLYATFFYLFSGNKFDVVVDEVHGIPFFTPLYVHSVPKLVLIHEVAGEIWDYMYPKPINYIGKALEKFYLRLYRSQYFWMDAKGTIDELVEYGIDRSKCTAIPCPSSLPILTKIPVKNKKPTFVWVSRIVKMKGIEDVLEAFSLIVKKYPDARLNIIGDGDKSYVNYLKKDIVKKHNIVSNVNFLGYVNEKEKVKVLQQSHILLHASVKEGWGIVVIEAASQATPSIVYNVPGLNESVKNGLAGIIVNKNTPDELAKQAIELFKDDKKNIKFQKECLNYARGLDWDSSSKESMGLITKLVKGIL